MGRRPRSFEAGIYHVAAHGSDTRLLFVEDADREDFLLRLPATAERFELGIVSYVLLGNHYHVLLRTRDERLSAALHHLHSTYARAHNRRHGRSAHLFRAHPYAGEISSNEQLATVSRYLARNPVEAGLERDPFEWPWSSVGAHAGIEKPAVPLLEDDLRDAFGEGRSWRARYRDYVASGE